jgi:hypothetical protein
MENEAVFGWESSRSGDPSHSRNQLVAGRAFKTFSAKHRKVAALSSEETTLNTPWLDFHVEGTVASADGKLGQLVGGIGLATQKAGCLALSGIKKLESGIAGNGEVGYPLKFKRKDGIIFCIAINCFHMVVPPFRDSGDSIDAVEWCHHLICIAFQYHNGF